MDSEKKTPGWGGENDLCQTESQAPLSAEGLAALSGDEVQRLVHELQTHEIELERQVEKLKRARLEIARTRDKCTNIYETAPFGYVTLDRAARVRGANLAFARMLGVEKQRVLRANFTDFVAVHCRDSFFTWWRRTLSGSAIDACDLELRAEDGATIQISLSAGVFDDSELPQERFHIVLMEVNALKNSEATLLALNRTLKARVAAQVHEINLLATAAANLGEGILITEDSASWYKAKIVFANQALCEMVGYALEELLGRHPAMLLPTDCPADEFLHLRHEPGSKRTVRGELAYRCKNGELRDIDLAITPFTDDISDVTHYVSIQRDITANKRTQAELQLEKDQMQALLNTAQDAIITTDRQGVVQDCNPAVERLFGYKPEELRGRNVDVLMPEPHRSRHDAYLRRHRGTGEVRILGATRELMAQHRDGRLVPVSLSVSDVDHLDLFVGFVRDTSDLRKLQGEILRATSAEQIRIGQALHDGPQQELAGLSLEAAGLTMDLARTSSPYEPRVRALSNGLKEANRHIRHLAQGLVPVQTESVGLMAALEDLARRTHDGDSSCRFVCPNAVEVSDTHIAEQLFHIAREAVTNAVKHADADEIVIRLDRSADGLILRVSDNGRGIDEAELANGGLGLSIMPYRSAAIGGELAISVAEEGGTAVCCTVPDGRTEPDPLIAAARESKVAPKG